MPKIPDIYLNIPYHGITSIQYMHELAVVTQLVIERCTGIAGWQSSNRARGPN